MQSILITGNHGFIASYLARHLMPERDLIGIDIESGYAGLYNQSFVADICDTKIIAQIFSENSISHVIHTAAEKSLAVCESDFARARKVNYDATMWLAEMAVRHGARFIFISSDQVFSGKSGSYSETARPEPINSYGRLKVLVEEALTNEPSVTICRTALVFGPVPYTQRDRFEKACQSEELQVQGYIVQHTRERLAKSMKIHLPADEYISPTHVDLLSRQLIKIINSDVSGVLHCCGGERISRYEFGLRIARKYGLDDSCIIPNPGTSPLRPKDVSLDCKRTEEVLGMKFDNLDRMLALPL